MGEGYVHQGSLLPHVVPGRHERVALAEARLRDLDGGPSEITLATTTRAPRRRGFCGEARSQASSSTTAVSVISLGLIRTCARALAEQRQAYKQEFCSC